jgi:hypothetical protein
VTAVREGRPGKGAEEANPLEPRGCAACERGESFTEARAYVHTGMGAKCRGKQLTRPPADPPPSRAPLSVNSNGKYKCGKCGGLGHNSRSCKLS